jgi:hypothetical protein
MDERPDVFYDPSAIAVARGASRLVLLVGPWAIKLPSWRNGTRYLVQGMLANMLEAERYRASQGDRRLMQVYACGPLGRFLLARRYRMTLTRRLTPDELRTLPLLNLDNNGHNVAVGDDGTLIALDYGDGECYYCPTEETP